MLPPLPKSQKRKAALLNLGHLPSERRYKAHNSRKELRQTLFWGTKESDFIDLQLDIQFLQLNRKKRHL